MARYISDQNKVAGIHESGTYAVQEAGAEGATGSVFWFGEVTEHSVDDAENKIEDRFLGTATRNFDNFIQGPRDVTGTLTFNAQDMRLPFWAIGSVVSVPSGTGADNHDFHVVTEIATNVMQSAFTSGTNVLSAPMSFTIEDSKQSPGTGRNFIRTINGCVPNTVTISATQGEKVSIVVDYIGQTLKTSSGTTTTLVETTGSSIRPYLWSDTSVTIATSGLDTVKSIEFEINNNIEAPHYLNGSRDIGTPFQLNKNYTLTLTMDLDGNEADFLYNEFYKGNGSFNTTLDFNADGQVAAAGSAHALFFMSGCIITSMENPSTVEGTTETTIEIRPQSVTGSAFEQTGNYNPF